MTYYIIKMRQDTDRNNSVQCTETISACLEIDHHQETVQCVSTDHTYVSLVLYQTQCLNSLRLCTEHTRFWDNRAITIRFVILCVLILTPLREKTQW